MWRRSVSSVWSEGTIAALKNWPSMIQYGRQIASTQTPNLQTDKKKNVAVLGGGISGLVATKSCLEEGLDVVCFEKAAQIGGTWVYSEENLLDRPPRVYEGLIMNVSREMTRFSDFPMPKHYPTFLSSHQYLAYLNDYADHFNIHRSMKLNTKVHKVTPLVPGALDNGWKLTFSDQVGNEQTKEFDAVLVCSGFYRRAKYPEIPGLYASGIDVKHIQQISTFGYLKGKKVVVIGNQNSAGDAACLAANVAEKVLLSIGDNRTVVVPRCYDSIPADLKMSRLEAAITPQWVLKHRFQRQAKTVNTQKMRTPSDSVKIMINDELPARIQHGDIKIKPGLMKLKDREAFFSDGSVDGPIDAVICATGYSPDFKYIDCEPLQASSRTDLPLYKGVFPLGTPEPTVACLGADRVLQGSPPVMEAQARWAAHVLSGKCQLPHPDVRKRYWNNKRMLYKRQGHVKSNSWDLMDAIADEFNIKPTFWKIFSRDPYLALHFAFGPPLPAFYRLFGPGSTEEAWEDCLRSFSACRLKDSAILEQQMIH